MVDKEPLKEYALPKILIYLVIYLIGEIRKEQSRFSDFRTKISTKTPSKTRPTKMPKMVRSKIPVCEELPDIRPSVSTDGLKTYND